MIKVNFKAYNSYVTDSLYQWDINQDLTVSGLNLWVEYGSPEVHFSNRNTDRAIVRQATLENHTVKVRIPNSLLQEPYTIYAHIGVYEGDSFKVVEKVEIPVIPKVRPSDYQIEDTDEEIYSFKELENKIVNVAKISDVNQCNQAIDELKTKVDALEFQTVVQKCSGCVVFSTAYPDHTGTDFIASSMVPLVNAEKQYISLDSVKIVGTDSEIGVSRFNIGKYGTGFCLYTNDSMAVQTVAGKAVSFEFTLQN